MKKVLIFTLLFNLGLNLASAHPNPNPAVQFGSVYNLSKVFHLYDLSFNNAKIEVMEIKKLIINTDLQ